MAVRLIAFDLDDSLLRDDRTIAESDIDAVCSAREHGIIILPASGRRLNAMEDTLRALGHTGPALALNGAKAIEIPSQKRLYERYIPLDLCLELQREAAALGGYMQTYLHDDFQYNVPCEYSELYRTLSGGGGEPVGDLGEYLLSQGLPSQKLLMIEKNPDKMTRIRAALQEKFGRRLSIYHSKPIYLEITHPEA